MEEDDGLVQEDDALTEDDVTPVADNVAKRTVIIDHVVQAGETASSIAEKFGISVNTILWENGLSTKALIRPGDTLRILPFTGVTYKVKSGDSISLIAKFYEVDQAKIAEANGLSVNQGLKINQLILIPGGRQIVSRGTPAKPTKPTVKPRPALVELNDNEPDAKPVTGAKMNWPTKGHTITQYYSWRHNGVDIANKTGTPIYSAGDGVVVTAQGGYNGGYGNTIVIDHGAGKKTRYGHLSSLKVEAGDSVTKGELIGAMGSTGRSTGPHLHFEIIIGGKRYNPLNYVSY
jgi:murein DD-endopeptidase MepM/ murein hydrolase activator NlpD